jgi:hypothetical protein
MSLTRTAAHHHQKERVSRSIQGAVVLVTLALLAGCGNTSEPSAPTSAAESTESTESTQQSTAVPDLTGLLGADAASQLDDAGMTASFIAMSDGTEVTAVDAATRPVIRTSPAAGDDVRAGRTVSVFVGADLQASPTPPASNPAAETWDLTTDAGLCAADAELTNLELNDAIAPLLGFPAVRGDRSIEENDAIRAYKNEAFGRACPERASE